jgi:hypothetical protein
MVRSSDNWPAWWEWEIECSNPHLIKRMADRGFSEIVLREMLESAKDFRPDHETGRYVVETMRGGRAWEVVVEPDAADELLIVVTAYPVG